MPFASASLADQMQGWGAVAGAVFSALAALAALLLYRHEVTLHRNEHLEAEAAQARMITLKVDTESVEAGNMMVARCTCTNYSDLPIVNVRMIVSRAAQTPDSRLYRSRDLLAPGDHWAEIWDTGPVTWRPTSESIELLDIAVRLEFVDASGRRWERLGQEHPRRVLP